MMFLYDARSSVVLLSPKNKVKPPTQSAAKGICMGKWTFEFLAELFLKNKKASDDRTFLPSAYNWIAHELQVGTSLGRRHNLVRFQI